jgi:integrase
VFPQADGRIANAGQYYLLGLKKALKAAGIEDRITWHQHRHYYASILMFQTKTPPETVSRLMGHKSFDFTMRTYGHWLNEEEADFAFSDALGAAFSFPARSPLKVVDGG